MWRILKRIIDRTNRKAWWRTLPIIALVLLAVPVGAFAQDRDICLARDGSKSIEACTRLIGAGQLTGRDLATIYVVRAAMFRGFRAYDRAIDDMTHAIEILKGSASNEIVASAYDTRASYYVLSSDTANALADYRKALTLDPINSQAKEEIGRLETEVSSPLSSATRSAKENADYVLALLFLIFGVGVIFTIVFGPSVIALRSVESRSKKLTILVLNLAGLILAPSVGSTSFKDAPQARGGIVVLVFFVFWIVAFLLALRTKPRRPRNVRRAIAYLLLIIVAARTFLFQPFNIPSGGDIPTLLVGDYLLVSKYSYGYTHYSLPFSPNLFPGRVPGEWVPQRGDMAVFRLPRDDTQNNIDRIVGLPGDRIQMIHGVLNINGVAVKRERVTLGCVAHEDIAQPVMCYREMLPNGVTYITHDLTDDGFLDNTEVYTVPPRNYFMLGDNRDRSTDSRVQSAVGYVPFENLIGKAQIIYFSIGRGASAWDVGGWLREVRRDRLLSAVQ
jgi:signal peptidase I